MKHSCIDPPASPELLDKFSHTFIDRARANHNTTYLSFSGAGETSAIRYLLDTLPNKDKNSLLFILFDAATLVTSDKTFYTQGLLFLKNFFEMSLDKDTQAQLQSIIANDSCTSAEFEDFIYQLTFKKEFNVTYIFNSIGELYAQEASQAFTKINSLTKINPLKVSSIFLMDQEYGNDVQPLFGDLTTTFFEHIVHNKDFMFDLESTKYLVNNHAKRQGKGFSKEFVEKISTISFGDPKVLKHITIKALENESFKKAIIESTIPEAYLLIGKEWLDSRYSRIITTLQPESIRCLSKEDLEHATSFLLNAGLVQNNNGRNKYINLLFEEFIKTHSDDIAKNAAHAPYQQHVALAKLLTAKEFLVFSYLQDKNGTLVTRDEIAHILWGKKWHDEYSDWAIDKVISNIRKKIKKENYPLEIKSLKGQGFLFI